MALPEEKVRVLIWDHFHETMPREELRQLQGRRLRQVVERAYHTVPHYRRALDEAAVSPEDIRSIEDIRRLPFTTKDTLRENYPFGMLTVPLEKVVRIHASSGTTGKPVVAGYTKGDLETWTELMARTLTSCGTTPMDVVHNAYGYGLFTGGLGFHMGAERIGATVVPISGGLSKRQIMLMEDFGATVLTCTPSYALVLAETAEELGVQFKERMKVRIGIFGAEPWTQKMRSEIEARMGIEAFDIYGLTEMVGPGVSVECPYHDGLHVFEDHFYAEIIDPETGDPVGYGEKGELVLTTLTKEGFPVLRFRTRDRTALHADPCRCGRTMVRMEKITGRTDDMLIIRGVNVFPSQIEEVILAEKALEPQYVIVVDREKDRLDKLEIRVEALASFYDKGPEEVARLEEQLSRELLQALGISAAIKVVEPGKIERSQGKARRVIDLRELD